MRWCTVPKEKSFQADNLLYPIGFLALGGNTSYNKSQHLANIYQIPTLSQALCQALRRQ